MTTNVKIVRARDFIRATPEGTVDLEGAQELLRGIAASADGLDDFDVLIDVRRVNSLLSASELWFLSEKLVKYRATFTHKTAVLCPLRRFDHARFFALCAENLGYNIEAFLSYEEAMEWLVDDETTA